MAQSHNEAVLDRRSGDPWAAGVEDGSRQLVASSTDGYDAVFEVRKWKSAGQVGLVVMVTAGSAWGTSRGTNRPVSSWGDPVSCAANHFSQAATWGW